MTLNDRTRTPEYVAASKLSQAAFEAVRLGHPDAGALTQKASAAFAALTGS